MMWFNFSIGINDDTPNIVTANGHGERFCCELTSACKERLLRKSKNTSGDICAWIDGATSTNDLGINKLMYGNSRKLLLFAHGSSNLSQICGCDWLDRCVLVTDIQTLNRNGFEIYTSQYAFERQVDELLNQLADQENTFVKNLRNLHAIVIWLSTASAIVVTYNNKRWDGILAYAPNLYAFAARPADVLGDEKKSCLFIRAMAVLAQRLFNEKLFYEDDALCLYLFPIYYIAPAVHDALLLFALVLDPAGTYTPKSDDGIWLNQINTECVSNEDKDVITQIVDLLRDDKAQFTHPVHIPLRAPNDISETSPWSMYACLGIDGFDIARRIMRGGPNSVKGLPMLERGKFRSFDQKEAISVLNIERLIDEYCAGGSSKPLNIAILGSPGAGKSFFLNELINGLNKKNNTRYISRHTINLSQLSVNDDAPLNDAFQNIRDESLEGSMPLLFVDEFDTDDYRWIVRFLAPMQDGQFIVGSSVHRLPRCILVFAGGVSRSLTNMMENQKCAERKIPDFISRLHATQTVWGVDYEKLDAHRMYIARRAIILKQSIDSKQKGASFDEALQYALLNIKEFNHGARSIARFCNALTLDSAIIGRSCLPNDDVLEQYINVEDFWNTYGKGRAMCGIREQYGKLTYKTYTDMQEKHFNDKGAYLTNSYTMRMGWEELSQGAKDINYDSLWHIEQTVSRCNLSMCDIDPSNMPNNGSRIIMLAREEHMRWMSNHIMQGQYFGYGTGKKPYIVDCDTLIELKTIPNGNSSFELDKAIIRVQLEEMLGLMLKTKRNS